MYSLAFTFWVLTSPLFGLVQVRGEDVGKDPKMVFETIYPWRESLNASVTVWENIIVFPVTVTKVQSERFAKGEGLYKMQGPEMFFIDESTGLIWLMEALDRETYKKFELMVFAVSLRGEYLEKPVPITIHVEDLNDNKPFFLQQVFTGSVLEFSPPGTVVMQMSANDEDNTLNTNLVYSIIGQKSIPGNDLNKTMFEINEASGIITVKDGVLDREVVKAFQLRIRVTENVGAFFTNEAVVIINVTDINNHIPEFSPTSYHMTALENTLGDIGRVNVTDADEPGTGNWEAKYSISDDPHGYFSIRTDAETNQGILSVVKPLDYESATEHKLTLQVVNINPMNSISTNFLANVTVTVVDKNDQPYFTEDPIKLVVPQNVLPGTSLKRNIAIHPENLGMRFEITDDPENWLDINIDTGEIVAKRSFKWSSVHVKNQVYTVTIKLTDTSGTSCTATVQIILVANNSAPQLSPLSGSICKNQRAPSSGLVLTALKEDLPPQTGPFSFEIPEESTEWNVTRVNDTHAVLQPGVDLPPGVYQVIVMVSDSRTPILHSFDQVNVTVCVCDPSGHCQTALVVDSSIGVIFLAVITIISVLLVFTLLGWLVAWKSCRGEHYNVRKGPEDAENAINLNALSVPDTNVLVSSTNAVLAPTNAVVAADNATNDRANIADIILRYLEVAAKDPNVPARDEVQIFHYEGESSVSGSLSSICSYSSDEQEQNLKDWGPRFQMLTEIYDPSEEDETITPFYV